MFAHRGRSIHPRPSPGPVLRRMRKWWAVLGHTYRDSNCLRVINCDYTLGHANMITIHINRVLLLYTDLPTPWLHILSDFRNNVYLEDILYGLSRTFLLHIDKHTELYCSYNLCSLLAMFVQKCFPPGWIPLPTPIYTTRTRHPAAVLLLPMPPIMDSCKKLHSVCVWIFAWLKSSLKQKSVSETLPINKITCVNSKWSLVCGG